MRTPREQFSDSCAILIALLKHHEAPVEGLEDMPRDQRLGMIVTMANEIVMHSIAIAAGADYESAKEGLAALGRDQGNRLKQICDEMTALVETHH